MAFDLVADQLFGGKLNRVLDQRYSEIGNADVAGKPVALDLAQRADGFNKRNLRIGPMQQQQIDLGQPQPGQAIPRGALEFARRKMVGPDFRGDEDLAAFHSGGAQPLAHVALVIVHFRGVDVAIAEPQSLFDHARAGAPAQLPGAKPEQRNFRAVGLDDRCRSDRRHGTASDPIAAPAAG